MVAQRASAPVRIARLAAAVLFVALAAAVALRLAERRGGGTPAPAPAPPPEGRAVDLKERIRHQEFRDGRPVVDVRGASFSLGSDGRNHLTGPVEIVNLGEEGQILSRLTADEVVYDPGSLRFTVSGHVRVESGDLVLEGGSFEFDREAGLFGTTAGGSFAAKGFSGRAAEISYRENVGGVRLGGGFRLELAAPGGTDRATVVSGQALVFDQGERRGRVDGRASIEGAGYLGTSETAGFVVSRDKATLESADLDGAAKIVLAGTDGAGEGNGEIRAGRISCRFSREPAGMAIQASGRSSLSFRPGPEKALTVLSPELVLSHSAERSTWTASGGATAEIAKAGSVSRTLEGQEIMYDGAKILHVTGVPGRPAVADSAEARIEAPEIAAAPESGDLQASGGVSCVLKRGEDRRKMGFFSPLEDVLASCERLEVRTGGSMTLFSGNVRVRQGADSLRAGELETDGDKGRMRGARGVAVTLAEAAAAGRAGRTSELSGEAMAYSPPSRTLTLTSKSSKSSVRLPEAGLEAETVSVVISRDGRAVESLSAAGSVTVSRGRYAGRSEAASYDAATGHLTLTGRPVLTDDKGGSARGAKLTFDLPDDKIFIENEGAGRATTVIKS